MTCWDKLGNPTVPPAAILEWKYDEKSVYQNDIDWLKAFSAIYPLFVGYAVTVNPRTRKFRLSCTRIENGCAQEEWLHLV